MGIEQQYQVRIGIHPQAYNNISSFFSAEEEGICKVFARDWYVTRADKLEVGNSVYRYILIKPTTTFTNLFLIYNEIIVIFHSYSHFEPRTLDVFSQIKDKLGDFRVENLCGILVSKCAKIDEEIISLTKGFETRIIVPFSYAEIKRGNGDAYLFRNKMQRFFYDRDLFAYDDALKTDLYFFGRNQIVMNLINRHLSGQTSGLFGLRKTGKTSILFDIQRRIDEKSVNAILISCQNARVSNGSWIDSIYYIYSEIYKSTKYSKKILEREAFNEINSATLLAECIDKLFNRYHKSFLIMFDEVEHITYQKAASEQWRNGRESVHFWKAMRYVYQMSQGKMTYLIAGTNPICLEYHEIDGAENPIFDGATVIYVPGFEVNQTREMVRKLGRIMGIKFDETLYSQMTEDYGGHPFLVRRLCSFIASNNRDRPCEINRKAYKALSSEFNKTQEKYFAMILDVLTQFYPLEYDMLKILAEDDHDTFAEFAESDSMLAEHLIGYGIIKRFGGEYEFNMDVIKDYLVRKEKIKRRLVTKEEKWSHICSERGNIEVDLRIMVKNVLLYIVFKNEEDAKSYVIKKIYNDKKSSQKAAALKYAELFDPKKANIYLKSLTTLILGKWEDFALFINMNQEEFSNSMNILNSGRYDAHAKIPTDEDMILLDAAIEKIKTITQKSKAVFKG